MWWKNIIPDILLRSVANDEIILYKSPKIVNGKAMIVSISLMILGIYTFFTILLAYILENLIEFIFAISGLYIIATPVIIIFMIRDEKKVFYFLLTNKTLYVYYHKSRLSSRDVHSYPLNSFKGFIFRKRFFDKNYDSGTIEFISDDLLPKKISLKNVPQMSKLQNHIESIFFYYGNLQERWTQISKNNDYQFPQICDVSEIKLKELRKLKIIFSILFILIPLACFLISFLFDNLIAIIAVFSAGIAIDILFIINILIIINRTSDIRNQLILNRDEFILKKKKTTTTIPLNKTTCINILRSKGPFASQKNILENFDFIKINNSYKSKICIKFGPFTKLPYLIGFLFCYLIVWKSNHGYLMSKEELINQNSH